MTVAGPSFPEPGLWESVWRLLRLRLTITASGFRRAKTRAKVGYIVLGVFALAFLGFLVWLSFTILSAIRSPRFAEYVGDVSPFFDAMPTILISIGSIGILMASFGVLLQALYLSGDMEFLMSAPIPRRAIFIAKLVEAVLPNFGIMCLFMLPFLFGMAASDGYNVLFYPFTVVTFAALSLTAAAVGSLLVMAITRIFPAKRVAEVLGFVVGTGFFVLSQSNQFIANEVGTEQVAGFLQLLERFNQPWSPLYWAGHGLTSIGQNQWLGGFGLLALALLFSGGVFAVILTLSERLYYSGWASMQGQAGKTRKKSPAKVQAEPGRAANPGLGRVIPTPLRAIIVKDLLSYRRDLKLLTNLVTPLILGVVYAIGLIRARGGVPQQEMSDAPAFVTTIVENLFVYGDVGLAMFMGWMLASGLALSSFSSEGKNYWMLKMAPLSPWQLLSAKFLVAYLPSLLVSWIYLIVLQVLRGATLTGMLVGLTAVALMLAGVVGINLALSVRGANFKWDSPQQMNKGIGCLGTFLGFLYLPVCFLLFIAPSFVGGLLGLPGWIGQAAGLLLGGAAALACVYFPLRMVIGRVPRLAEN